MGTREGHPRRETEKQVRHEENKGIKELKWDFENRVRKKTSLSRKNKAQKTLAQKPEGPRENPTNKQKRGYPHKGAARSSVEKGLKYPHLAPECYKVEGGKVN